jgi:hypothetical protein
MNQASSYTSYSYANIQRLACLSQQFAGGTATSRRRSAALLPSKVRLPARS